MKERNMKKIDVLTAEVTRWVSVAQALDEKHGVALACAEAASKPAPGALERALSGASDDATRHAAQASLEAKARADELGVAASEARQKLAQARAALAQAESVVALARCKVLARDVADLAAAIGTQTQALMSTLAAHLAPTPDLPAAALFYLIYAIGLTALVLRPNETMASWQSALWRGAIFGLVAYATYDLTNQATLSNWPWSLTVIDMAWGTTLSGLSAAVAAATSRWIENR